MSTYYRPKELLKLDDVRDLKDVEVIEEEQDGKLSKLLHSNGSYLHFETNSKGYVIDVYRFGGNDVDDVFPKIEKQLGVSFTSEYDDDYEDYCDEETEVWRIHYPDGYCIWSNKLENDDGVITISLNFEGDNLVTNLRTGFSSG